MIDKLKICGSHRIQGFAIATLALAFMLASLSTSAAPPEVQEAKAPSSDLSLEDDAPPVETAEPGPQPAPHPAAETASESDATPEEVSKEPEIIGPTDWPSRINILTEQIDRGESEPEKADLLYAELAAELWAAQADVYDALRQRAPDALDRRTQLDELYDERIRLLQWVTPAFRAALMGGSTEGMREVQREFANAKLDVLFQTLAIPRGIRRLAEDVRESPLNDLWNLLKLTFGVLVFRGWRRWAKTGLVDLRERVLDIRPRAEIHLQTARVIWSIDRFRGPLEWLALLSFASSIVEPGDLEEVANLAWIIILWTLLTQLGFYLVHELAARGIDERNADNSDLRLRSLRLVATWILLTGLGLDLTSRYVGEAAIYTWATRLFLFLLIPFSLLLLYWWRPIIFKRLNTDFAFSATARRIGKSEKGLGSYVNAAAGAVYIAGSELLQFVIRGASRFEGGRKIVATLLRRQVARDAQRENVTEKRISEQLVYGLLTSDDTVIEGPYREGIDDIKEFIESGRGGSIAVLAERGGGLGTFLRLLKEDVGASMRIIDCPPGGPQKFSEALTKEFGLTDDADLATALRPRLDADGVRVVAVGNYHRIARPQAGGLVGMTQTSEIAAAVGEDILWIVALTRASWPYINLLLGDRAIVNEIFELSPWSESQLGQLVDSRCKKAGIDPDYRRLSFPRQFDDGERAPLQERNRTSYRRVLWELSEGNPEVAIRLFADSLRELPSGKLVVRLPQLAPTNILAKANRTTILVLKVLVETELASVEDLQASIRAPLDGVTDSLAHCIQQGWVEQVYDHFQITWAAYRIVKRVLVRRGLIPH